MYTTRDNNLMTSTITEFRKDLFRLAEAAQNGENVEFVHHGVVFKVTADKKKSKLEKLVGQTVMASGADLEAAGRELAAEMEAEWNADWSAL